MKHEIETIRYAVVVILAAVVLALMVWTLA